MISVHLQGKPFNIMVIQVYAPTSNAEEAEVERFYEDIQDFLELTPKKDDLFIIGDWNAKVGSQKTPGDTCTPMFIAALFIIARTWKQPRCPSADEWIRKLWYIHTMEYYSAIKKNTFESVLMRWMKLEPIIQSEVRKKNTNTVY